MAAKNELHSPVRIHPRERLKAFLWVVPTCFLLDFFTKILVKNNMTPYGDTIELIDKVARLRFIYNEGIAFGLKVGFAPHWVLAAVSLVVMLVLIWYYFFGELDDHWTLYAMALIVAGAAGNLYDRIMFGKVVDFMEIGIGHLTWPVFNVADMAVTFGAVILGVRLVFPPREKSEEPVTGPAEPTVKKNSNHSEQS